MDFRLLIILRSLVSTMEKATSRKLQRRGTAPRLPLLSSQRQRPRRRYHHRHRSGKSHVTSLYHLFATTNRLTTSTAKSFRPRLQAQPLLYDLGRPSQALAAGEWLSSSAWRWKLTLTVNLDPGAQGAVRICECPTSAIVSPSQTARYTRQTSQDVFHPEPSYTLVSADICFSLLLRR